MAADEVYRQERPPINPSDRPNDLSQIHEIHRQAATPPEEVFQRPSFQGNMPPGMQKAMQDGAGQIPHQIAPESHRPVFRNEPEANFRSKDFDALLEGLKQVHYSYEEVTLPSLGKFYNGSDGPVNGILHIRQMTGNEEQYLASTRFLRSGEALNKIFKDCIRESINPENLLVEDRTYLMIYLRGMSYGTDYEVNVACSECGQHFDKVIQLDLDVNECPANFNDSNLIVKLPVSGYVMTYRFQTGKDVNVISNHSNNKIKDYGPDAIDDTSLFKIALMVNSVSNGANNITDRISIQALLQKMPIKDVLTIKHCIENPPFGVLTKQTTACPFCPEEFSFDIPMGASFFFPPMKPEMPA